ncbi:MAG: prenyltransferase/squalene oxidase repeat-containing protein [Planctomycetota bacterium]
MPRFQDFCLLLALSVAAVQLPSRAHADEGVGGMIARATGFLRASQQESGSFSPEGVPDYTALVIAALLESGTQVDDPMVQQALAHLQGNVQEDGGIYQSGSRYRNYETCLAILAFSAANTGGDYDGLLADAEAFAKKLQWDEGEGVDPTGTSYGGAGYGRHKRPDMSNSNMFAEALVALGNGPDDPAMQRLLVFVSRCQNLESEYNTTEFAGLNPDGGFYYTIAAGGSSQAGETANGGLRSYGSMTYAGLKSMIYAGVTADDPRVKAAVKWVSQHYSVEQNPGMGTAGYYYYLHTLAKALGVMGVDTLADANGVERNWRADLAAELASRQNKDGSWTNANRRWLEGDANLVTGYVLLTLANCQR